MVTASVEFEGVERLEQKLYTLEEAVRTRIVRRALEQAADNLAERMADLAPVDEGNLAASIDVALRAYRGGDLQLAYAGPTWPRGAHGNFAEGGTAQRYTREGYYRGQAEAYPFVAPAFEAELPSLEGNLASSLRTQIEREVAE